MTKICYKKCFKKLLLFFMTVLIIAVLSACTSKTKEQNRLRQEGLEFMEKGDYPAAISRFDDALDLNNGKITALETDCLKYRAEAEIKLGEYEAAAYTYELICRYDDTAPEMKLMQAYCLARCGKDLDKAVSLWNEVGEKSKDTKGYRETFYALVDAYMDAGTAEALLSAEDLLNIGAADETLASGDIFLKLGNISFDRKEYEAAIGRYQDGIRYLAEHPDKETGDSAKAMTFNMAAAYEYNEDFVTALKLFKEYTAKYGPDEKAQHEIYFLDRQP